MLRRTMLKTIAVATVAVGISAGGGAFAQDKPTIALIPGLTTDAFYITMHKGAQKAADALGVELIYQVHRTGTRRCRCRFWTPS